MTANLSTGVQLGVHVDIGRVGTDVRKDGGRHGDCAVDQKPAEVQVGGGSGSNVKRHNDPAARARIPMVNVRQEGAVDVRELDSVVDRIAVNRDCRETLSPRRSGSWLVRAAQERDIALRSGRY